MSDPLNPYAAPQYQEEYPQVPIPAGGNLASLGQRFMGRLVDNLGSVGISFLALFTIGDGMALFSDQSPSGQVTAIVMFFAYALPFNALQWWLIVSSGQSLGKKLANTRIVRDDGSPVGFTSGVVLREWVITAIASIPFVGRFVGLIDAILIFVGEERKTLHDRIAGTKVVDASVQFKTDAELESELSHQPYGEERPRKRRRKKKKATEPAPLEPTAGEPVDAEPLAAEPLASEPADAPAAPVEPNEADKAKPTGS
jgi:uncharacterized RDD family membrane protein YckC